MDLETIVIAGVSLLICGLPFIIMIRNRQKNEKKMINELSSMSNGQLKLTKYESLSNIIIGLDETNNKIYFFNQTKSGAIKKVVDLEAFEKSEVIRTDEANNDNSVKIIQSVSLRFLPKNKSTETAVLELYNAEETGALAGELQLANEWCQYLNEKINKNITTKN